MECKTRILLTPFACNETGKRCRAMRFLIDIEVTNLHQPETALQVGLRSASHSQLYMIFPDRPYESRKLARDSTSGRGAFAGANPESAKTESPELRASDPQDVEKVDIARAEESAQARRAKAKAKARADAYERKAREENHARDKARKLVDSESKDAE